MNENVQKILNILSHLNVFIFKLCLLISNCMDNYLKYNYDLSVNCATVRNFTVLSFFKRCFLSISNQNHLSYFFSKYYAQLYRIYGILKSQKWKFTTNYFS